MFHSPLAAADAAVAGPPWISLAIAVLLAVGGIGGVVTLLNLPKMRKKIDAETTQVLTGAAVALVEPLREQVEQLTNRVALLERDKLRMETEKAQHASLLAEHAEWDSLARAMATELGRDLPATPPLFLPAA